MLKKNSQHLKKVKIIYTFMGHIIILLHGATLEIIGEEWNSAADRYWSGSCHILTVVPWAPPLISANSHGCGFSLWTRVTLCHSCFSSLNRILVLYSQFGSSPQPVMDRSRKLTPAFIPPEWDTLRLPHGLPEFSCRTQSCISLLPFPVSYPYFPPGASWNHSPNQLLALECLS